MLKLNKRQSLLEGAIGQIKRATREHGEDPRTIELVKITLAIQALRDPDVVTFLEAKRLKRVQRPWVGA